MLILGFQKMTLLDFPGKVACTIFTGGCNFRCPFCHNARLVTEIDKSSAIDSGEILDFLKTRTKLLDGVCITGGEPLLQPDIKEFISEIKKIGYPVKLDTNGFFPEKLKELVEEKLVDYVAMDVKNSEEKYGETIGLKDFDLSNVNESIDFLLQGKVDFEFRTTIIKEYHDVSDVEAIAKRITGAKNYFLQNFVDSGKLIGENLHPVDVSVLENMLKTARKYIKNTATRGV